MTFYPSCIVILIVVIYSLFSGVLSPFDLGSFDEVRWVLVVFLLFGTLVSLIQLNFRHFRHFRREEVVFTVGIGVFVFSAVFSECFSGFVSEYWLSSFMLFLLFFLFIPLFFSSFYYPERARIINLSFYCILVCSAIYSMLYVFLFLLSLGGEVNYSYVLVNSGFENVNFFGQVATWIIPLLSVGLLDRRIAALKWAWALMLFSLCVFWFVIISVSVKGTFISLALAFFCMAIYNWNWVKRSLVWAVVSFVFSALIWGVVSFSVGHFSDGFTSGSMGVDEFGRVMLWKEAFLMSFQSFPLGMGGESWLLHDPISDNFNDSLRLGHPHNMYLLMAAEYGWLAVLGVGIVVVSFVYRVLKFKSSLSCDGQRPPILFVGLCVSVLGGLVHSGVSGVLLMPKSMSVGLICMSMLWAITESSKHDGADFSSIYREKRPNFDLLVRYGFIIFFVFVSAFWVKDITSYYQEMAVDRARYVSGGAVSRFSPRFWQHGYSVDLSASYQGKNLSN